MPDALEVVAAPAAALAWMDARGLPYVNADASNGSARHTHTLVYNLPTDDSQESVRTRHAMT